MIDRFKNDEIYTVLATKAFGMGVDISDIFEVYHHAPSGNISDYIQEIGRVAREKSLEGKAIVDFANKDLKFTRILYGLSSVKQYQIKLVLQKISNIFEKKKKQNLLFSIEDFQYIFPNAQDPDSKIKSTLLLLENDLLNKYGYYVIIVRPKSLYSNVFAEIPREIEKDFLSKYGEFCSIIRKPKLNETYKLRLPTDTTDVTISRYGSENNFYVIKLDKLWEQHFSDDSFPRVKRRYFNRELFYDEKDVNPIPLNRLEVSLNTGFGDSLNLLKHYWLALTDVFQELSGHFFDRNELEKLLKDTISERILRKRIVDMVLNMYSARLQPLRTKSFLSYDDSFLQMRTESNIPKYRVMSNSFYRVSKTVLSKFKEMFHSDETFFEKYLNPDLKSTQSFIRIAHLIESFQLGSYEFSGGVLPQVFVRINDPFKVRLISNDETYANSILQDINSRHKSSMSIMEYFFTEDMDDSDRWDFIEHYFLGRDVLAERTKL